jgi:hypothetical protein
MPEGMEPPVAKPRTPPVKDDESKKDEIAKELVDSRVGA